MVCKIRDNIMECDTKTFLNAMGVGEIHPEKVEELIFEDCAGQIEFGKPMSQRDADKAFVQCQAEQMREHKSNLEGCVSRFMENHPMNGVKDVDIDWDRDKVKVEMTSKDEFLSAIRETMNGMGPFWARSNKELIEVAGGGDIDETIVSHFPWLKHTTGVWGRPTSIERCMERR